MPVPTILIPDDAGLRAAGSPPPMREVKLGAVLRPMKTLVQLRRLLGAGATPPPAATDYSAKAQASIARMYLNDQLGDCVIAGKMHKLGLWSANDSDSGGVVLATDAEVRTQYLKLAAVPGTDSGCIITDVLDYFTRSGLVAGGKTYKIDGYVPIDHTDPVEVKVAILLMGSLTLGINLPQAWTTGGNNSVWDTTNTQIVGGHDVCAVGYDQQYVYIATWGGLRRITWAGFTDRRFITELYACLGQVWYGADKTCSALGWDYNRLKSALDTLKLGQLPDITPPVPVPPVPPVPPIPVPPIPPVGGFTGSLSFVNGAFMGIVSPTPKIDVRVITAAVQGQIEAAFPGWSSINGIGFDALVAAIVKAILDALAKG